LILLVELAKAAESLGLKRLDLGKGLFQSKASFMSGAVLVAEGSVSLSTLGRWTRRFWYQTRGWLRSSFLSEPIRRLSRPFRGWLTFR
jgi:hypothetical protein